MQFSGKFWKNRTIVRASINAAWLLLSLQLFVKRKKRKIMLISYSWLQDYLPVTIAPERLSHLLTSLGLEVESLRLYESIPGLLKGLIVGEVAACEPHPNANRLKCTRVLVGDKILQIVCGAPNVAVGQKVIVAKPGTTIYPVSGAPVTIKKTTIRNVESEGMLCAEDEVGIGPSHEGIVVLPPHLKTGSLVADYYKPYSDWVFEIGLTPNRIDAMSHIGVVKDVCAYLSLHEGKQYAVKNPFPASFQAEQHSKNIQIVIENTVACKRYAGIYLTNIQVAESPEWLKNRLLAIGVRPINNIVDITNYVLHETAQPLHAYDADAIAGDSVFVKNVADNTVFITLDGKERKLHPEDLMICNQQEPMCIAGVMGGIKSGVTAQTKHIFLESAWFQPATIRKTMLRHQLRTDAAMRFEKHVDISLTTDALKRAALLMKEIAGAVIASDITDVYPEPFQKTEVVLPFSYLKKLSGKNYEPVLVKNILENLQFEITEETTQFLKVAVPFNKPDVLLAADLVEEIVRIDGLDNIPIPSSITISPAKDNLKIKEALKQKISSYLSSVGFFEIVTNSITNSRYFSNEVLAHSVKMLNNLSADLNILRPSMLPTGLEVIAYNLHRKNNALLLFEIGKVYQTTAPGVYEEAEQLCLYLSGASETYWLQQSQPYDYFYAKGIVSSLLQACGILHFSFQQLSATNALHIQVINNKTNEILGFIMEVDEAQLQAFEIKQPVYFVSFSFEKLLSHILQHQIVFKEPGRFPAMHRDIAMVINKAIPYHKVEQTVQQLQLPLLQEMRLFDIFENEKIGKDKKSIAIHFTFSSEERTLTDKEVDEAMNRLMHSFETNLQAAIRK